ncbi:MAG: diaminopimelate decarboxylase [Fimbriimonadaceae bacterium]
MPAAVRNDTRFRLSEAQATELAATYGTPLYVIDEAHFRAAIKRYRAAAEAAHPNSEITFAGKANSTLALLTIADSEGCEIDVASEGELRAAIRAGVPAARCHLHGNNKQTAELRFAIDAGVGQIVVDHFTELETLATMLEGSRTKVVLRLAPGVDPVTHAKISTGQADTKFGFNISDGSAEAATVRCLELGLPLIGFHCHVGSQLLDPEAQRAGGEHLATFAAHMLASHQFDTAHLNVGGGLGVRYTDDDAPMAVEEYCRLIVDTILPLLHDAGLDPVLAQEPGRSLIAESGVTLYRVGVIKTVPTRGDKHRTYVAVDGGLSDNPRPVMYGSRYTVERIARGTANPDWIPTRPQTPVKNPAGDGILVTISGKHCETDRLFEDVVLPADLAEGDLLQVLCTGAYNASMANTYNRYPRPAAVLVLANGGHALIQRRDTWDEMFAREVVPPGLGR